MHENERVKEDFHIKVKPFNPRETDWFTYKTHFEALACQAAWTPRTKCVRLMSALQGNLTGIMAGLSQPVTYKQLSNRLDGVHGISNSKEDASLKLNSCRKEHDESIPLFAERVRQLVKRLHPNFTDTDKEEQALRAFVQGLPQRHNLRMQMRIANFKTLQEASAYGARLELIIRDEIHFEAERPINNRSIWVFGTSEYSVQSDSDDEQSYELSYDRSLSV